MKYKNKDDLRLSFLFIINNYILNESKSINFSYNKEKLNELKEYVDFNNEDFISESFEDLVMFLETVFEFDNVDEIEYKELFLKIKEIGLNLFAYKLQEEREDFYVNQVFKQGDIDLIKEGVVFHFDDEIYLAKSNVVKTSKGYQITASLLFDNEYQFSNNIYINLNDQSFSVIGMIKNK